MAPETPKSIGRYEILEEIGKGAMGLVYLARDPLIGRLVAIKTVRIGLGMSDDEVEQFRARFMREAQSCGILNHPNIVTIHDVVERTDEGHTFIAMEFVRGTNLKKLLRQGGALPLDRVVHIVTQIAEALDYAHSKQVVHRDVKPANILLTEDTQVKITDFGIARLNTSNLTHDGQMLGTPNYMAPEQIQGRELDHRADIFSLGVVLYEMLTRKKPFQGENVTVVTHRIVYDDFAPLDELVDDLPAGVKRILDRALAKEPEQRYQRARELADDLRSLPVASPVEESAEANETQDLSETLARDAGDHTIAAPSAEVLVPPPPVTAADAAPAPPAPSSQPPAPKPAPPASLPETPKEPVPIAKPGPPAPAPPPLEAPAEPASPKTASARAAPPSPAAESPAADLPFEGRFVAAAPAAAEAAEAELPPPRPRDPALDSTFTGRMKQSVNRGLKTAAEQSPSRGRLMLYLGGGVAVLLLGLLAVFFFRSSVTPPEVDQLAEERMQWASEFSRLMVEGAQLAEEDDLHGALEMFRRAQQEASARREVLLADRQRLLDEGDLEAADARSTDLEDVAAKEATSTEMVRRTDWRIEAGRLDAVAQAVVIENLELARTALDGRRFQEAMIWAQAVLEVDPGEQEAQALVEEIEPRLAARRSRRAAPPPPPPPPPPEPEPEPVVELPAPAPPPPVVVPTTATLDVEFVSELPRGVLMIYLDEEQLLRENFRFGERSGLFRRSKPVTGRLERSFTVPVGSSRIKVYVSGARNQPTQVEQLSANFPGGSLRQLRIQVDAEGRVTARLR